MAELSSAAENRLPDSDFGLIENVGGKKVRKYPMPDRKHAANAKDRAAQQLSKGHLTRAQYNQIVAKANRKLGQS